MNAGDTQGDSPAGAGAIREPQEGETIQLPDIIAPASAIEPLVLQVPNPPAGLSYADYEDYHNREFLLANGVSLTEEALVSTLESGTNVLQAAAAHTLGSLSFKGSLSLLRKFAEGGDDLVKAEAAYALVRLGDAEGKAFLQECLDYPINAYLCPSVAAGYLARLGDAQGFPIIVKCLNSDIYTIRMLACKQLYFFVPFHGGRDKDSNIIDVFAQFERALKDPDSNIQWQALVQLREIRSPASRSILEEYVENSTDEYLREVARGILESMNS